MPSRGLPRLLRRGRPSPERRTPQTISPRRIGERLAKTWGEYPAAPRHRAACGPDPVVRPPLSGQALPRIAYTARSRDAAPPRRAAGNAAEPIRCPAEPGPGWTRPSRASSVVGPGCSGEPSAPPPSLASTFKGPRYPLSGGGAGAAYPGIEKLDGCADWSCRSASSSSASVARNREVRAGACPAIRVLASVGSPETGVAELDGGPQSIP